ncbi:hypothetical protein K2173_017157 [Erythroxylum novogranatense]|uniref:Avr9/Cf-9 rapidly elicited protein n=1 Tax=Erythroxylum novogranatense TaxID=1862640 RepID=A0AAV8U600_9ROSI|nr:hypothetical protein K2173_017157 [Erythroxylum novogranatense]
MMSLFSSFDALCAEFTYGKKLSLSLDSGSTTASIPSKDAAAVVDSSIRKSSPSDRNNKPSPCPSQSKRSSMKPRFAPELDGVNCFESIVPY